MRDLISNDPLNDIFVSLAEFERELIKERTIAGLEAARARGKKEGVLRLSKATLGKAHSTELLGKLSVSEICEQLITFKQRFIRT